MSQCVPAADGARARAAAAALPVQREHGAALPGRQAHQAGEHQRRRPGGRPPRSRARPHLDHHPLLPGMRYTFRIEPRYAVLVCTLCTVARSPKLIVRQTSLQLIWPDI